MKKAEELTSGATNNTSDGLCAATQLYAVPGTPPRQVLSTSPVSGFNVMTQY